MQVNWAALLLHFCTFVYLLVSFIRSFSYFEISVG